jgi:UDP-N-acetylglucosamine 2-epimerase (non-hydrolysing)
VKVAVTLPSGFDRANISFRSPKANQSKSMSLICQVVAARPNFMKMAPVILEARRRGLRQIVVHTGQHYDAQMSESFIAGLGLPKPDFNLAVSSGSHAEQTARVLVGFEKVCEVQKPDLVVVAGDVNSTLACALVAAKLLIPVAHVESGLRSFDRSMPEEINRLLTDQMASLLFTTEESGTLNLLREGIPANRIHFVGNSMIDSLRAHLQKALAKEPWRQFQLQPRSYGVVTLHRPGNVDDPQVFREIAAALRDIGEELTLIFPVHPRTRQRIDHYKLDLSGVRMLAPAGYLDFLGLMARAALVLTDSGGIQEETTALRIPCVTLRRNTERPVTLQCGMNRLAGVRRPDIIRAAREALTSKRRVVPPELWDGRAGTRIVETIKQWLADCERRFEAIRNNRESTKFGISV